MAEGPCSGEAVQKTENAAVEMYRFAAVEIDPCADPCAAKGQVRERVIEGALAILHRQNPASFAEVPAAAAGAGCLEEEAPVSGEDLSHLLSGAGRGTLREWLGRLTQAQRAVFLQRAVLGRTNADTAQAINRIARPGTWTAEAVGNLFRQALCSLASAMVHSAAAAHA
jgi:hypothetical protein